MYFYFLKSLTLVKTKEKIEDKKKKKKVLKEFLLSYNNSSSSGYYRKTKYREVKEEKE